MDNKITDFEIFDLRFPTSQLKTAPSDAVHRNINFSCAYVIVKVTDVKLTGHGFAFTLGRGTEIITKAVEAYKPFVVGKILGDIYSNFGEFWKALRNEEQLRWIGPDKGAIHMALAAITNALWDLWAKIEDKALWKLLVDMSPEQIVNCLDFTHMSDAITKDEALALLQQNQNLKAAHKTTVMSKGVPAYITSVGWIGYSDEMIKNMCHQALKDGWTSFKMKVGNSLEDDRRRAAIIRQTIGDECQLMMDCNQVWDVQQAIDWMKHLAEYKPVWIEEPTHPDDVEGHLKISKALNPLGIRVATGEHCSNAVLFKQYIHRGALQFAQIDATRLGGVNENIMVMLLARKFGVPVCPHAGGTGLCELVQHLAIFNAIVVAPNAKDVVVEFADHLHEHFVHPILMNRGSYVAPQAPGYSSEVKRQSIDTYAYPNGAYWKLNRDTK